MKIFRWASNASFSQCTKFNVLLTYNFGFLVDACVSFQRAAYCTNLKTMKSKK
jgi:hypothetical protein